MQKLKDAGIKPSLKRIVFLERTLANHSKLMLVSMTKNAEQPCANDEGGPKSDESIVQMVQIQLQVQERRQQQIQEQLKQQQQQHQQLQDQLKQQQQQHKQQLHHQEQQMIRLLEQMQQLKQRLQQ